MKYFFINNDCYPLDIPDIDLEKYDDDAELEYPHDIWGKRIIDIDEAYRQVNDLLHKIFKIKFGIELKRSL